MYVTKYRVNGSYQCFFFDNAKDAKKLMIGLIKQGKDAICMRAAF